MFDYQKKSQINVYFSTYIYQYGCALCQLSRSCLHQTVLFVFIISLGRSERHHRLNKLFILLFHCGLAHNAYCNPEENQINFIFICDCKIKPLAHDQQIYHLIGLENWILFYTLFQILLPWYRGLWPLLKKGFQI